MKPTRRFTLACLLLACCLVHADVPSAKEIDALIAQLGDDSGAKRRAAAKKLEAIGEPALPALRKAETAHRDIDVRLRAGLVVSAIERTFWNEIRHFDSIDDAVPTLAVSPDGKRLVSGGWKEKGEYVFRLWDLESGKELKKFEGHKNATICLTFAADGKRVLSGSFDGTCRLWDVEKGKELTTLKDPGRGMGWCQSVAFLPDGKHAVVGGVGGAWLSNLDDGGVVRCFFTTGTTVDGIAVSRDGKRLIVGRLDHAASILDVKTADVLHTLNGHTERVSAVAFAPDGKHVATCSDDKTVRLWDAETGKEVQCFTDHTDKVLTVAFSPDGKLLLTASHDGTARLLGVETGKELHSYRGHKGKVLCAVFTPDGKRVLTSGDDRTIRVWPIYRR
jgi:WD40 repeat protein